MPGATDTHHMTIRNCNISKGAGSVETRHAIYLSHRCSNITVEYNTITGLGPAFNPGANATAGVHCHHDPMPTSLLIQRNIIRSWPKGIIFYSESAAPVVTGSILHNTFQNNDFHIDARHHSTLLVRDNVGDNSVQLRPVRPDLSGEHDARPQLLVPDDHRGGQAHRRIARHQRRARWFRRRGARLPVGTT